MFPLTIATGPPAKTADITLTMEDETFVGLSDGKNSITLFSRNIFQQGQNWGIVKG